MYMYMYMQLYLCHFLPLMHPDLAQYCIAVVPPNGPNSNVAGNVKDLISRKILRTGQYTYMYIHTCACVKVHVHVGMCGIVCG